MLTSEQLQALGQPFDPALVQWKPGATSQDKSKALALAYVDSRAYFDRLDAVAPGEWADDYEVIAAGTIVKCRLTIGGVTRCDVGEKDGSDQNTTTSAAAQAFKRACAKFGLGRYLYRLPQSWQPYDAQRRQFTSEALANLRRMAGGSAQSAQERQRASKSTRSSRNTPQNGSQNVTDAEFEALPSATEEPEVQTALAKAQATPQTDRGAGRNDAGNGPHFRSPDEAQQWAMGQGVFKNQRHCTNAYDKLRRKVIAEANGSYPTAAQFFDLWVKEIERRRAELNAELDATAAADEVPQF